MTKALQRILKCIKIVNPLISVSFFSENKHDSTNFSPFQQLVGIHLFVHVGLTFLFFVVLLYSILSECNNIISLYNKLTFVNQENR